MVNEEVKDTTARKKAAFKELCRFPSEKNKTQYKGLNLKIIGEDRKLQILHLIGNAAYEQKRALTIIKLRLNI